MHSVHREAGDRTALGSTRLKIQRPILGTWGLAWAWLPPGQAGSMAPMSILAISQQLLAP